MNQVPYIPRDIKELRFADRINSARLTGRYGLLAFWGGIALSVCSSLVFTFDGTLDREATVGLVVGGLSIATAVCLIATSVFLHISTSLRAVKMKRMFPQNPLPNKFLHAEFVRWIHRVDLILVIAATMLAIVVTFTAAAPIAIPSGLGLGFLGWAIASIWGIGANRVVYREIARQKKLAKAQPQQVLLPHPNRAR